MSWPPGRWEPDRGPWGVISGMGPGQRNLYHNFSHIEDRSGWRQNTRARTNISTFDNRSRGTGPRDGGTFGALVPGQGYAHAEIYPGEATIEPDRQPKKWGPDFAPGYGELIPGIDGGTRYGYRETHPRFALAEWGRYGEPYVPGRPGEVVNSYVNKNYTNRNSSTLGYSTEAEHPNIPEPREFSARVEASMKRQLAFDGEDRAQQWATGLMTPEQLQQRYQHLWR